MQTIKIIGVPVWWCRQREMYGGAGSPTRGMYYDNYGYDLNAESGDTQVLQMQSCF